MDSLGRKLLLPLFALSIALALAMGSTSTRAVHFDQMYKTTNTNWDCNTSLYCQTDGWYVTWFPESNLSAAGKTMIRQVLRDNYDPTVLLTVEESSSTVKYTGWQETDIIFLQKNLPSGIAGRVYCDDPSNSTQCDQHYVEFDSSSPGYALVCHETGHAVGLTHGAQASPVQADATYDLGCMGTASSVLVSHVRAQINATY